MSADRVACKRGHPITPGSTTTRSNGTVVCRECKREDNLKDRQRLKARLIACATCAHIDDKADEQLTDEQFAATAAPGSPRDLAMRVTSYRLAVEMATALLKMGRTCEALTVLLDVEAPTR